MVLNFIFLRNSGLIFFSHVSQPKTFCFPKCTRLEKYRFSVVLWIPDGPRLPKNSNLNSSWFSVICFSITTDWCFLHQIIQSFWALNSSSKFRFFYRILLDNSNFQQSSILFHKLESWKITIAKESHRNCCPIDFQFQIFPKLPGGIEVEQFLTLSNWWVFFSEKVFSIP